MAPRRRARARKNSRMDAALDAMRPLGFSEKLVKETVKELLKVYGEDGWYFFESDSYRDLINEILQKQTNGTQEEDSSQNDSRCGDNIKIPAAGPSTSREVILGSCSNPGATYTTRQTNEALDSMSQTSEVLDTVSLTNDLDGKERPPPAEGEERGWMEQNSGEEHMEIVTRNTDKDSGGSKLLGNTIICSLPDLHSPQPVDVLPAIRHRPYYGWISSDDEQDIVHLTPAPIQEIAKFFFPMDGQRKRKTRWDVRPEDM